MDSLVRKSLESPLPLDEETVLEEQEQEQEPIESNQEGKNAVEFEIVINKDDVELQNQNPLQD